MAAAASGSRPGSTAGKKSEESVCVAVNIRPLIDIELDQGCQECLYVTPGLGQVGARAAGRVCGAATLAGPAAPAMACTTPSRGARRSSTPCR